MELIESRFYDVKRINNTAYLIMMAIEEYIAQEIFKSDASRVIYSSDEFAFRQRINKLYPSLTPPYTSVQANQLQFPFANYFREKNWYMDTRAGVQSAQAALYGIDLSSEIPFPARFLQGQMDFSMNLYFNRDDDAQNAYDILMWIQNPTPKQFTFPGLMYKSYAIDIPIVFTTTNLSWTNQYKEKDWLEKNRIIVLRADFNIKSVLMDQFASGTKSNIFEILPADSDIGQYFITRECVLDFLSYKNDPLINQENIVLDLISSLDPDPLLNAVFSVIPTEISAECTWDFDSEARSLYNDQVLLMLNTGEQAYVNIDFKTFTFPNLIEGSTYTVAIYFTSTTGSVIKKTITFVTVSAENQVTLKGMIGLEF